MDVNNQRSGNHETEWSLSKRSEAMCTALCRLKLEDRDTPSRKHEKVGGGKRRNCGRLQKRGRKRKRQCRKKCTRRCGEEEPAVKASKCRVCGKHVQVNETDSDDAGLDSDWELAQRSFEFQVRHSTRPFGYSPISFIDHWPAQRLAAYQATCTKACVVEDSDDGHRDRCIKE